MNDAEENLLTMLLHRTTLFSALFPLPCLRVLAAIAAAILCASMLPGCAPPVADGSGSPAKASPTVSAPAPRQADPATAGTREAIVIEGDLSQVDWRSLVGQQVAISGELVVVDTFNLLRWGEVKVARERLFIPTEHIDPNDADSSDTTSTGGSNVAEVTAAQKRNTAATLIIDDGFEDQNTFPPRMFPELGTGLDTVRLGSVVQGVSGEIQTRGNSLVLVPNTPLTWTLAERPQRPSLGEPAVSVACFNVLNYFSSIDDGRNDARGADSEAERERQEAKLTAAILAMQADVIGLMELENNLDAEARLVASLNRTLGALLGGGHEERFAACGLPAGFRSAPGGSDAIRVGIIYRSDRVSTVGDVEVIVDEAFREARAPLVQAFTMAESEQPFTVVVNHWKSKGGADEADADNKDRGDGQGAYNATRRDQAAAICRYVDAVQKREADARILVIGDFNAYSQEDPLDTLRAGGLVDLRERQGGIDPGTTADYSYVYYGQCGSLDHAFGTESMAADVTGIATWHINADELRGFDYNQEYNPEPLYEASPYRSSDHDPVLIGIAK
ncbi:MAG: ExeM/NucH family extracellular endonuclease [Pirellulales bacterium]|nr:ExeM/NucH family extracellular endonuclease [Pirellulales bacterium]